MIKSVFRKSTDPPSVAMYKCFLLSQLMLQRFCTRKKSAMISFKKLCHSFLHFYVEFKEKWRNENETERKNRESYYVSWNAKK